MPICLLVDGTEHVTVNSVGSPCDFYGLTTAEYSQFQALTGAALPTPDEILYVYTWGMGAILLPFSIAFAVKWALKVVKLI